MLAKETLVSHPIPCKLEHLCLKEKFPALPLNGICKNVQTTNFKGLGYFMAHLLGLADIHPLFYMISILDYMVGDLLEAKLFRRAFSHKIA